MSPAPADSNDKVPVLYDCKILMNVEPVSSANSLEATQVNPVQVTNGCTTFVNDLGKLAPNTKVESVVDRRKDD